MTLAEIKRQLRDGPYAWPGGYPKYFLMDDGEAMSFAAVRQEWRQIVREHLDVAKGAPKTGWFVEACDINWEDPALFCAHTNERIESAYAEDDAE